MKGQETCLATEASPLVRQIRAWQRGIGPELAFWERWFATRGSDWPEEFKRRLRDDTEISGLVAPSHDATRVLEVGSGPLTLLGKNCKGKRVDITATDPLANFYLDMATRHGIVPLIPVQQAFAEDLSQYFQPESFDVVYCANALDHSFDPVRGIEEMLIVLRPGGRIVLEHAANEAEHENYTGFHQWNFDERAGSFVMWNVNNHIDVSAVFAEWLDTSVTKRGRALTVTMQSRARFRNDQLSRARIRIRDLLGALLVAGVSEEGVATSGIVAPLQAPPETPKRGLMDILRKSMRMYR
jgi:SAM-dependent methyltransferase